MPTIYPSAFLYPVTHGFDSCVLMDGLLSSDAKIIALQIQSENRYRVVASHLNFAYFLGWCDGKEDDEIRARVEAALVELVDRDLILRYPLQQPKGPYRHLTVYGCEEDVRPGFWPLEWIEPAWNCSHEDFEESRARLRSPRTDTN